MLHVRGQTPEVLLERLADPRVSLPVAHRVVARCVGRDRDDLDGIPGLSRQRSLELETRLDRRRLEVVDRRQSTVDPFVKYIFSASDGALFETVRIPLERPRWSVCVSSQAGCALACAFCQTGKLGLTRSLESWEIVDQVLAVRRDGPERPVTSVVFQGQGEPFQNYEAVIEAASLLRHPVGLGVRGENITISTVGILPMIERFTDEAHPFRLILSLTSAFGERRAALIPAGQKWDVPDLAAAMRRHAALHGGPVHLAWVLMAGLNTGEDEARELARLFRGVKVRLSVIDVNDPTGAFRPAGDAERGGFFDALRAHGIPFARRYSGGPDIHAACGMLAASVK